VSVDKSRVSALTEQEIKAADEELPHMSVQTLLDAWQRMLLVHGAQFDAASARIDEWDEELQKAKLRLDLARAEASLLNKTTSSISQKLKAVRVHQKQLDERLSTVERDLAVKAGAQSRQAALSGAARERREYYTQATRVNAELADLQEQVKRLVKRLRDQRDASARDNAAAMAATVRDILDAHSADLEWVDKQAKSLVARVLAVEKKLERLDV
jgi:chromosome segregation ATPase